MTLVLLLSAADNAVPLAAAEAADDGVLLLLLPLMSANKDVRWTGNGSDAANNHKYLCFNLCVFQLCWLVAGPFTGRTLILFRGFTISNYDVKICSSISNYFSVIIFTFNFNYFLANFVFKYFP